MRHKTYKQTATHSSHTVNKPYGLFMHVSVLMFLQCSYAKTSELLKRFSSLSSTHYDTELTFLFSNQLKKKFKM